MKKMFLFLLTAIVLPLSAAPAAKAWQSNYGAAQKTAAVQKKPMMILFTAPAWCGYCVRLEKNVFGKAEFQKLLNKTVPVMLDFSEEAKITPEMKELAGKYQVQGFPTLILTDADGKIRGTKVGFGGNADDYIRALNQMIVQ